AGQTERQHPVAESVPSVVPVVVEYPHPVPVDANAHVSAPVPISQNRTIARHAEPEVFGGSVVHVPVSRAIDANTARDCRRAALLHSRKPAEESGKIAVIGGAEGIL